MPVRVTGALLPSHEVALDLDRALGVDGQRPTLEAKLGVVGGVEEVGRREVLGGLLVVHVDTVACAVPRSPVSSRVASNSRNAPSNGATPM